MTDLIQRLLSLLGQFRPVRIVMPNEGGVRTFCGHPKTAKAIGPGLHCIIPFLHSMDVMDVTEQVVDMRAQSVTTSDGRTIAIGGAISYRVNDPIRAIYRVQDIDVSLPALSLGVMAHYVTAHTFDACQDVDALTDEIKKEIRGTATERWGIGIINVWITDLAEHRVLRVLTGDATAVVPMEE